LSQFLEHKFFLLFSQQVALNSFLLHWLFTSEIRTHRGKKTIK